MAQRRLVACLKLSQSKTERLQEALVAFVAEAAERYFQVTLAVTRSQASGSRLPLRARRPDLAWKQAGATCELVAVNVYPRVDLGR